MTAPELDSTLNTSATKRAKVQTQAMQPGFHSRQASFPRSLVIPSPPNLVSQTPQTLLGRQIGVLIAEGFDSALLMSLRQRAQNEKAEVTVLAPHANGARDQDGILFETGLPLMSRPSFFFDTVVVLAKGSGACFLASLAAAQTWVGDAFAHLKVIGHTPECQLLLDKAGVLPGAGVLPLPTEQALDSYISAARKGRIWERENALRMPG